MRFKNRDSLTLETGLSVCFRSVRGGLVLRSRSSEPRITFDWGDDTQAEKFMHVDHGPDGLAVTLHPGLSYQQISEAAKQLGEHGPAVIQAWQRQIGFTDLATET